MPLKNERARISLEAANYFLWVRQIFAAAYAVCKQKQLNITVNLIITELFTINRLFSIHLYLYSANL